MLRQFDQGPFMVTTVYDSLWNLGGNEAALWNFMKSLTGKTVVPMDAIGALAVVSKISLMQLGQLDLRILSKSLRYNTLISSHFP